MSAVPITHVSNWILSRDGAGDSREFTIGLPFLRLMSPNGSHSHWAKKAKRVKSQRTMTAQVLRGALLVERITVPCAVYLTRLAPSGGLDFDNLVASGKAVRDGVADALGVKDNDPRVSWHYAQRPSGKRGTWGVEIRIVQGGQCA